MSTRGTNPNRMEAICLTSNIGCCQHIVFRIARQEIRRSDGASHVATAMRMVMDRSREQIKEELRKRGGWHWVCSAPSQQSWFRAAEKAGYDLTKHPQGVAATRSPVDRTPVCLRPEEHPSTASARAGLRERFRREAGRACRVVRRATRGRCGH